MPELVRFGVSMDPALLEKFDQLIAARGYSNRSEALRDLVRAELVRQDWTDDNQPKAATLTIVYDHHHGDLTARLTELQHDYGDEIISTLHVHLDHHNCMEVLVLRGQGSRLRLLADHISSLRGVKHGQLHMTTTGHDLP